MRALRFQIYLDVFPELGEEAKVVAEKLRALAEYFETQVPPEVLATLPTGGLTGEPMKSATFSDQSLAELANFMMDTSTALGWKAIWKVEERD